MLKKILSSLLFIALAAGAVYSWQKVDFNRKTARFFQVVYGDESVREGRDGRPYVVKKKSGPTGDLRAELGQRGPSIKKKKKGPGRDGGRRGHSNISLGNVSKYAIIMAFFVMLTRLIDRLFLKFSRSRRPA